MILKRSAVSVWHTSTTIIVAIAIFITVSSCAIFFYSHSTNIIFNDIRQQLLVSATLASKQFTANELAKINAKDTIKNPTLASVVEKLEFIKNTVPHTKYVYIMKTTNAPNVLEFVAENDMFYTNEQLDYDKSGTVESNEQSVAPGDMYEATNISEIQTAFTNPWVDAKINTDEWGSWMSAYAPIIDNNGLAVAIIGIDIEATQFYALTHRIVSPGILMVVIVLALLCAAILIVIAYRRRMYYNKVVQENRTKVVRSAIVHIGNPISVLTWWIEMLDDKDVDIQEVKKVLTGATQQLNSVVRDLQNAS